MRQYNVKCSPPRSTMPRRQLGSHSAQMHNRHCNSDATALPHILLDFSSVLRPAALCISSHTTMRSPIYQDNILTGTRAAIKVIISSTQLALPNVSAKQLADVVLIESWTFSHGLPDPTTIPLGSSAVCGATAVARFTTNTCPSVAPPFVLTLRCVMQHKATSPHIQPSLRLPPRLQQRSRGAPMNVD
jgi:hypothetical protein